MAASNSSAKLFEDTSQVRLVDKFSIEASQSSIPMSSYQNIFLHPAPGMAAEYSVSQPQDSNQSSNFVNFLQQIDFSVPPPFPPPFVQTLISSANQVPHNRFSTPILSNIPSNFPFLENENFAFKSFSENNSFQIEKILSSFRKTDAQPPMELHKVGDQLKNYYSSLIKLKADVEHLKSVSSQLNDESWKDRKICLSLQWKALRELKRTINVDPTFLALLKYKIKKRQKKRKSKTQRKLIKEKILSKYEIAELHMQQLQQIADTEKQEQKFKMEADSILYSVRQKKSEANGQIQFLTALSKLHAARIHVFNSQNKLVPSDSVIGFNKILDKLKSMWERQLKEYLVEENGLKVMLKDLAANVENEDCTNLKKTFGQWLKLMFGTTDLQKGSYFSTINELIEIRSEWDKYVAEDVNSSKIPAGWVVPKYRVDNGWSKFVS